MATPESIRESLNLPTDCLPGAALVEVSFRDQRISDFHKRSGVTVVTAMTAGSADMADFQRIVTMSEDSPYLAAAHRIRIAEGLGEIPEGSLARAFALLHNAEFDESDLARFMPGQEV